MEIFKKNQQEQEAEDERSLMAKSGASSFIQGMLGNVEGASRSKKKPEEEKIADGFVKSQRNHQMRARDNLTGQLQAAEQEKEKLVQRLNDSLLQLDELG